MLGINIKCKSIITGFLVPGKTAGKLEVYDTSSGVAVGPWDIAAGRITFHRGGILNF